MKKLKIGDVFGEDSLDFEPSIYRNSIKALDNVKCFAISASNLIDVIGEKVLIIRYESKIKEKLSKSKNFIKTSPITIQKILENLSIKDYENETIKLEKPCKLDRLFILLSGNIEFSDTKLLNNEEILGDYSMFNEKEPLLTEEVSHMVLNGYIASLSYVTLAKILSSSHAFKERNSILVNEKKETVKIRLEDLIFIKNFGEGLFGPIYLVKNEETNKLFVLKCISKAIATEKNLEKHIIVRAFPKKLNVLLKN